MKFTLSTAPLKSGLNLGIVNANISKFNSKSTVVQITASSDVLRLNLEAVSILSEITLRGVGDGEPASIMVDSLLFKSLISTITVPQITIEFTQNSLIIHAGKSTFTLPKLIDTSEIQLNRPQNVTAAEIETASDISKNDWKFIKAHQMYAKADSYTNPVYTYVWVGEDGDVIVGDYINSLFTHSQMGTLGNTCLLSDTVINMFNSLPDGAKLLPRGDRYSVIVDNDSYVFISEFIPMYESDENGNYNAPIIMDMMSTTDKPISKVAVSDITTVLNQAALLSSKKDQKLTFTVYDGHIMLKDDNITCTIAADGGPSESYSLDFNPSLLKSVMSNCCETTIGISPTINGEDIVGITITSGALTVVLAGVE